MKYKKMSVWSGVSKNTKTTKMYTIAYSLCFVMLCILHITSFICNPNDDKTIHVTLCEHVIFVILFVYVLEWVRILMLFATKVYSKILRKIN